jgi:hypothetical protein
MVIAGIAVAFAIWQAESVGPPSEPAAAPSGEPAGACAVRLADEPPRLGDVPPLAPPKTTLIASAELPKAWLAQQIGRRAPVTLASAKRKDVGAAGEVSYVVSRGDFAFELEGDRLWVRTPIGAQAEICKPIGPICPTYGSCAPRLGAGVGVPLMVDALDGGARISLQIYEGCSIAGFDATPRIETQAKQQLAGVKATIDAALPSAERRAELTALLGQPWPLAEGEGCLRLSAKRLVQAPPSLTDQLTLRIALEGSVALGDCETAAEPLPIERGEVGELSDVIVPTSWPWPKVESALREALDDDGLTLVSLRGGVSDEPAAIVALHVEGAACGPLWLAAAPVAEGDALSFARARAIAPRGADGTVVARAMARLEGVRLPLPAPAVSARGELMRLEAVLAARVAELPEEVAFEARVEGDPAAFEALVDADGIRLAARRRFRLVAAPKP